MITTSASRQKRSLTGLVSLLLGGGAVLVAAIFTILLVSVVDQRHENSSARRASDLLLQSLTVEGSVVDLETGLRGYLLTREPGFLSPYHEAVAETKKKIIREAVAQAAGSYTEAAKLLGVHPNYLHRLIRNLNLKEGLRQ